MVREKAGSDDRGIWNMKLHIGTSGNAYKEWKGKFYPEKISPKEMLGSYSEHFNTVEIKNTFYRMPRESVLISWVDQVPDDVVFAFKAPRVITHVKRLKDVGEETGYLFRTLSALDRKLGPVLFQFPKSLRADLSALEDFFDGIHDDVSCAFEFRSPSWLDAGIPDLLRERGCSLCIPDADENPRSEIIDTTTWGYLLLRRSYCTDGDLSQWMERILAQNWERVFVFFKHEEEAKGPDMAIRLRELADSTGSG